jgi:rhomboid protease GluP
MAFGFSPKYVQEYALDNLNKEHFLVLAYEASLRLGWEVSVISENGFIAHTDFSWGSWSEEINVNIHTETVTVKSECTGNQLYDWNKNKKNVEQLSANIEVVKEMLSANDVTAKITSLREQYTLNADNILNQSPSTSKEKITGFFSIFKPTEGYYITPILININILVFLVMVLNGVNWLLPETQRLINWGANFKSVTMDGQWWRLLTCCFLHIGILHLLLNMYALLYIGLILEPYLGKSRFLAAYLFTGIAASVTSLWWNDLTVSAGASGAIFGMYGVFLALLSSNVLDKSVRKSLMTSIAVFIGYNLMNGFKPNSGIDNAAHIGGLLSGVIIGYAFIPSLKSFENNKLKYATLSGLLVVLVFSSVFVYNRIPNDMSRYDKAIQEFSINEEKALNVYNLPEGTPNEQLMIAIKDSGIYYWNQNIKIIDGLKDLDLPNELFQKSDKLKTYCELRVKTYELLYKSISEETNVYSEQINANDNQIQKLIDDLIGKP